MFKLKSWLKQIISWENFQFWQTGIFQQKKKISSWSSWLAGFMVSVINTLAEALFSQDPPHTLNNLNRTKYSMNNRAEGEEGMGKLKKHAMSLN